MTEPIEQVAILLSAAEGQAIILANLQRDLARAFAENLENTTIEHKRNCYREALLAIAHLLDAIGSPPEHSQQFAELAAALSDLNDAIAQPLLKPSKSRGKHGDPSHIWRIRATICIGLAMFTAAGLTNIEAASRIAKKHKKLVVKATKQSGDPQKLIRSWNDQFKAGLVGNEDAKRLYATRVDKAKVYVLGLPEKERVAWVDAALGRALIDVPSIPVC